MCFQPAGRRVIGQKGDRQRLSERIGRTEQRAEYPMIEIFDSRLLQFGIALVAGLIARLDMQINEIIGFNASIAAATFPS